MYKFYVIFSFIQMINFEDPNSVLLMLTSFLFAVSTRTHTHMPDVALYIAVHALWKIHFCVSLLVNESQATPNRLAAADGRGCMQSGWFLHCGSEPHDVGRSRALPGSLSHRRRCLWLRVVGLLGPCGFVYTHPLLAAPTTSRERLRWL